jgi:hypothetical protein
MHDDEMMPDPDVDLNLEALKLLEQQAIDDPDVIVLDDAPMDSNGPHGVNEQWEMDFNADPDTD